MQRQRLKVMSNHRPPTAFFLLVILLSIPIWAIGPVAERLLPAELPTSLPLSSLMTFTPIIAAVILVQREEGSRGVKALLKRAFDYRKIEKKAWYAPIVLFWPAVMILQVGLLRLAGVPLPEPQVPVLMMLVSFLVFFIAALGEEVGWQGYAMDPLQTRWNAMAASVFLGTVWAVWHIVPLIQMNRLPASIAWQCLGMVAARILIVWLYNNTGQSVFAAILFHAMINVSTVLLAGYGWPYDPCIVLLILAVAAGIVTFLWGPKTLARYRYARPGRELSSSSTGWPASKTGA